MKRLSDQTLYEIIEVSVDAPPEEVERACDRAAAAYGPGSLATYTLVSAEEAALLGSRIEEARAVLLDASARSRYDERIGLRPAPIPPEPVHPPEPAPTSMHLPGLTPWPPPEVEPVAVPLRPISPGLPPPASDAAAPPVTDSPADAPAFALQPSERPVAAAAPAPAATPPLLSAPIQLTVPVAPTPIALTRPVAPILLDRELAEEREPTVPEGGSWTGDMLRRARESRGLTVQQMAERTRITRHHIENIEQDRFKALPAPVYLRGIIMSLARELRLDGQKVARSYLDRMGPVTDGEPRR